MKKDLLICGRKEDCKTLVDKFDSMYNFYISTIDSYGRYHNLHQLRRQVKNSDILLIDVEDFSSITFSVISFALAYDIEIIGYHKDIRDGLSQALLNACDYVGYVDDLEEYFG